MASALSRHLRDPGSKHLRAAERVIKCLLWTKDWGIVCEKVNRQCSGSDEDAIAKMKHNGCFDADFATCKDTRKSRSGQVLFVDSNLLSWGSKTQPMVALSSFESETIAASDASKKAICQRHTRQEVLSRKLPATLLRGDNKPCLSSTSSNNYSSARTKHIDVRHKHMHQQVVEKELAFEHVNTKENIADLFTKRLPTTTFTCLVGKLLRKSEE